MDVYKKEMFTSNGILLLPLMFYCLESFKVDYFLNNFQINVKLHNAKCFFFFSHLVKSSLITIQIIST